MKNNKIENLMDTDGLFEEDNQILGNKTDNITSKEVNKDSLLWENSPKLDHRESNFNINTQPGKREVAYIPDKALKGTLLYLLKNPNEKYKGMISRIELIIPAVKPEDETDIYVDELENIISIYYLTNTVKIRNIIGLEHCINLEDLFLTDNLIIDLSPLENLTKLKVLFLAKNNIPDISPLIGLNNITSLHLQCNQITDISVLKYLPNIRYLNLYNNLVINIEPLKYLTQLKELEISENPVYDLKPLQNLQNLEILEANSCEITDTTPITKITSLKELSIEYNFIDEEYVKNSIKLDVLKL